MPCTLHNSCKFQRAVVTVFILLRVSARMSVETKLNCDMLDTTKRNWKSSLDLGRNKRMSYWHINYCFVDGCRRLKFVTPHDGHYLGENVFWILLLEYTLPFNSSKTRNTCIVEACKARERKAHKMSGMEGGERIGVSCVAWEGGFQHWLYKYWKVKFS